MVTDFLILENDGFPGLIFKDSGQLVAFPRPDIYASGFSSRVLKIENFASRLLRQAVEATRSISHLSEPDNILRHVSTRIHLLDLMFERTFSATVTGQRLVSLAAQ